MLLIKDYEKAGYEYGPVDKAGISVFDSEEEFKEFCKYTIDTSLDAPIERDGVIFLAYGVEVNRDNSFAYSYIAPLAYCCSFEDMIKEWEELCNRVRWRGFMGEDTYFIELIDEDGELVINMMSGENPFNRTKVRGDDNEDKLCR